MTAPDILVVCGPTASGKTALGVALAQTLHGEVVSADSMQIYRGMDVGTAKPTAEEMAGVPHHMLDVADPWEDYSVARYVAEATSCVEDIRKRGKLPILVGGTGLYIDHLIVGQEFAPLSGKWRAVLQQRAEAEGIEPLYAELARKDPQKARSLHPNDQKRVIRALEVLYETGKTLTELEEAQKRPPKYTALRLGLDYESRFDLWERINKRVDKMAEMGLVEEVQQLLDQNIPLAATAMQAIGYKELAAALTAGSDVSQALQLVQLRTRQYAKRQLTWFRRKVDHWIYWKLEPNIEDGRQKATAYLREFGL